jgi:AcrR family transcriptional regulator
MYQNRRTSGLDPLPPSDAPGAPAGLRDRKRAATRSRIAAAAAELAGTDGLARTTVDRIADTAEVGRATFFRYFGSKEQALAEGMNTRWLDAIVAVLAAQPAELGPTAAVIGAFDELGSGFGEIEPQIRELAILVRSSPALWAWTLQVHVQYEDAIAELLAPRMPGGAGDPRARLLGALAMGVVRIALDDWLASGGSLPDRIHDGLQSISIAAD